MIEMRLLIINPNSSQSITASIKKEAEKFFSDMLKIDVITSEHAPAAIETGADELIAGYYVLEELKKKENQYDGMIIACASDPGLEAAREILSVPVVGIFEAAAHVCNILGNRFCVISSCDEKEIPCFERLVDNYGYRNRFTGVKPLRLGVLGVKEADISCIESKINEAKHQEGIDAVVLGCAAFSGMGTKLTEKCGIYVSDGIAESILLVKSLIQLKSRC